MGVGVAGGPAGVHPSTCPVKTARIVSAALRGRRFTERVYTLDGPGRRAYFKYMPLVVVVTLVVFLLLLVAVPTVVTLRNARAKLQLSIIKPTKVDLPHSCPACDGSMERGFVLPSGQLGWSKDGIWLALTKDGKELGFVYAPLLKIEIAAPVVFTRPMTPVSGTYLVSRDVRVRAEPRTRSGEINRLSKGERVQAVGRPKESAWLAVSKDGKNLGFVYSPVLLPLIDGTLDDDLKGKASFGGGLSCDYAVRFEAVIAEESVINRKSCTCDEREP